MVTIGLACLMVLAGIVLLRFGGRRAISQMTFGSVMVMLSIGALFAEPVSQKSPWLTLAVIAAMLGTLVVLEWLQVQFNSVERLIAGKAVTVIENGELNIQNLRKLRLTVDKLEMRLREKGIKHIGDVKTATIEVNGELGYELKPEKEPLTVEQFERVMQSLIPQIDAVLQQTRNLETNLFDEIKQPNKNGTHPDILQ